MRLSVPAGISFEESAAFYRKMEPTLPAKPAPITPRPVSGLAEVLDTGEIDVVVLDAYGVLNIGAEVIPGAVAAVTAAQARVPVYILTNDASNPKEQIAAKHRGRGFDMTPEMLTSSADVVALAMARFPSVARWGVMAPQNWPTDRFAAECFILDEDRANFDRADGFLFLSCSWWTDAQMALIHNSLRDHPRPIVVGNPDVAAPDVGMFSLEPGAIAHELHELFGCPVQSTGKPHPEVFNAMLARHPEIPAERFLMVGDTPHTDILGGRAAGMKTLLLDGHGFLRGRERDAFLEQVGIWPDFVATGLAG